MHKLPNTHYFNCGQVIHEQDDTLPLCKLILISFSCRLFHQQNGRELKMLISEEAISSAKKLVETKQAADIIAVLDAKGVEITKDDEDEIIVYAESLASSEKDFPYYGGEDVSNPPSDETSVLLQGNTLVVIQVDGMEDVFATGDFNDV